MKKLKKIHFQQRLWGTPETGKCLQMHKKYLLKALDIYFGLSPKECQKLAYRFAKANSMKYQKVGMTNNKLVLIGLHLF